MRLEKRKIIVDDVVIEAEIKRRGAREKQARQGEREQEGGWSRMRDGK